MLIIPCCAAGESKCKRQFAQEKKHNGFCTAFCIVFLIILHEVVFKNFITRLIKYVERVTSLCCLFFVFVPPAHAPNDWRHYVRFALKGFRVPTSVLLQYSTIIQTQGA